MGGFKNLGWAEQGLKFLKSAYASPGQPHLLIFAREDADGGEREDEDEADDEFEDEDGREEGRPASNRPRSLDHLTVQVERRFLFRRVKILKSGFQRISRAA